MAYMMIRNSDQAKYGSLLNGMVSQLLMNNNQYPVNIRQATDILSNHKYDNHKTRMDRARLKDDKDTMKTSKASFTQNENMKTCYCCGKKGHMSLKCLEKDKIPKQEWAIRLSSTCNPSRRKTMMNHHNWTRVQRRPDGAVCICV